jgi:hypothetical protein
MLLYHPVSLLSTEFKNLYRGPFPTLSKFVNGFFLFGMDFVIILTFTTLSYKNAKTCHATIVPGRRSIKVEVGIYSILEMILSNYNFPFKVIQGVI